VPKVNNRSKGENSPNLVTLLETTGSWSLAWKSDLGAATGGSASECASFEIVGCQKLKNPINLIELVGFPV
jgi:hypothetical protein